jgi:hypothetical protein
MPPWYYFVRPTHLSFHDCTTTLPPPKNLRSLLGLGLKFIPTPRFTNYWSRLSDPDDDARTMPRFRRDFSLKHYFTCDPSETPDDDYNPRMYIPSNWTPPPWSYSHDSRHRTFSFDHHIQAAFRKRRGKPNLLPHQRRALTFLQNSDDFLIVACDKNLGPAIIEKTRYIQLAYLDHLNNHRTYQYLSPTDAETFATRLLGLIRKWLRKYKGALRPSERKFLNHHINANEDPFPVFYLTLKVHKTPLKTRPIVSTSGSLLYGLGVWIDDKLQQIATVQKSYFKSSFDLKTELVARQLPPNARFFSADAVAMYTNIPTARALSEIAHYIRANTRRFAEVPDDALITALSLLMTNSVFTFGDTTWKQNSGTSMGTPPAPPYANLYCAIFEDPIISSYPEIDLWRRFIDDGLGIWLHHTDPAIDAQRWQSYQDDMNARFGGLQWTFSPRSSTIDFMDLTIVIKGNSVTTTLFEKAMNLHLYIPPHSAHPPGVLSGLVLGMIYRIHNLCTDALDIRWKTLRFYRHLTARGYKPDKLRPLFSTAISRALHPPPAPQEPENERNRIFFHLPFHPDDPPSTQIQKIWTDCLAAPRQRTPLAQTPNQDGDPILLDRMTVCYSRQLNLGNLLSYRKLTILNGPPVSSYQIRGLRGPLLRTSLPAAAAAAPADPLDSNRPSATRAAYPMFRPAPPANPG